MTLPFNFDPQALLGPQALLVALLAAVGWMVLALKSQHKHVNEQLLLCETKHDELESKFLDQSKELSFLKGQMSSMQGQAQIPTSMLLELKTLVDTLKQVRKADVDP